jgi:hypothetical protein
MSFRRPMWASGNETGRGLARNFLAISLVVGCATFYDGRMTFFFCK